MDTKPASSCETVNVRWFVCLFPLCGLGGNRKALQWCKLLAPLSEADRRGCYKGTGDEIYHETPPSPRIYLKQKVAWEAGRLDS